MFKKISLGIMAILFSLLSLPVYAVFTPGQFTKLYVFGDSLSDTGNYGTQVTQQPCSAAPGQTSGYFVYAPETDTCSNQYNISGVYCGKVWANYLSVNFLGLPNITASTSGGDDFAYVGAQFFGLNAAPFDTAVPVYDPLNKLNTGSQINNFLMGTQFADPHALYVIWAGANDLLNVLTSNLTPTNLAAAIPRVINNDVNMLFATVSDLYMRGARNFLIINLPDISLTPGLQKIAQATNNPALLSQVQKITAGFNSNIAQTIQQLKPFSKGASFYLEDTFSLLTFANTNFQALGFTCNSENAQNWCFEQKSGETDPSDYIFFNLIHPSSKTHYYLAQDMAYCDGVTPGPASHKSFCHKM
jgi:phospholipase/lecithinase/hemolysin